MSRGFVKEDDLEHAGTDLPEKPISQHVNYVTPSGLKQLASQASKLDQKRTALVAQKDDPIAKQSLAEVDRDLRYLSARLETAQLVPCDGQEDQTKVLFGATVALEDETGLEHTFTIVGEDEADLTQNKVSYVSPIARALTGKHVGDIAIWQRPAGPLEIEILTITYLNTNRDLST